MPPVKPGQGFEQRGVRMFHNGMSAALLNAAWVKARMSTANGDCVELAVLPTGQLAIRNSRDPEGPALIFTRSEISSFLDGAKSSEFDCMIA
jgi:hypothetical protein